MTPRPLILSPGDDVNAILMQCALQRLGVQALHSSSAHHPALSAGSIRIGPDHDLDARGGLADAGISAVWNRRPRPLQALRGVHPSDQQFVRDEWRIYHANVFALQAELSPCLWVNPPAAARDAENKLLQLKLARAVGLRIPETLVSNDADTILPFLRQHGPAIYKAFMPHTWRDAASGRLYNVSVPRLDADTVVDAATLGLCPGIYQTYIDKRADIRVTVIGDREFAVRIQRDDGSAFIDWRPRTGMPDCIAVPCTLPGSLVDRIQALMRALGIVYGAVDLVEDMDGDLHFLEVNQTGQFIFVEEWAPELPLLGALASMLTQGRTDYSLDAAASIRLADCRDHDIYQAWAEQNPSAQDVSQWIVSNE